MNSPRNMTLKEKKFKKHYTPFKSWHSKLNGNPFSVSKYNLSYSNKIKYEPNS